MEIDLDLGDLDVRFTLKARRARAPHFVWHFGAPQDVARADRKVRAQDHRHTPRTGEVDLIMDLKADQKVKGRVKATDEVGNPVDLPADANVTVTAEDDSILDVTDNGDGSFEAAATGTLGESKLSLKGTLNGREVTGDALIVVVAGDAERFTVEFDEPEEVTPDTAPGDGTGQPAPGDGGPVEPQPQV
jgi:hypothetical protein